MSIAGHSGMKQKLKSYERIYTAEFGHPVEKTVAHALSSELNIPVEAWVNGKIPGGTLVVSTANPDRPPSPFSRAQIQKKDWIGFHSSGEKAWLTATRPAFLYLAYTWLKEYLLEKDWDGETTVHPVAFSVEKSTFDLFLTQYARTIRDLDKERYIREYARLGFTHIEVNALAGPQPLEEGVPGEFYRDFYTYCPALDQFVSSRLNKGIYPDDVLAANLNRLKENAALAVKYGLTPGLLCFEPRSVPEKLFEKYPTIRGARVDHPMRSFKPRYSLSLAHPLVKQHYTDLISGLLREVPELEFITIWTNDSGAGFEHTRSLYVGRNGGAYIIREWNSDEDIAFAAAANTARFFALLRDAARKVNPAFRVITRLESFYGERKYLWPHFQDKLDVEGNSLLTQGWEAVYSHPVYSDIKVAGSALQNRLDPEERSPFKELKDRGSWAYFYHAFATHTNHEPLLGIPFPWLTYEKIRSAYERGIQTLAHIGGLHPPDKVPFAVNQEVFRCFQMNPDMDIDSELNRIAAEYSPMKGDLLYASWKKVDEAVRRIPPLSIYTHYGVVWQRLMVRPLVPDINRIPETERAYYEQHMCSSMHNPNRVDLGRDVLFELLGSEYAGTAAERMDSHVLPRLHSVNDKLISHSRKKQSPPDALTDLYWRIRALTCWVGMLRNAAVWIHAVNTYLDAKSDSIRKRARKQLDEMMDREIENTGEWLEIWEHAPVEWMIISGDKETPFIYGGNLPELLREKIKLMQTYRDAEPFIDRKFMFHKIR